ncbi:type VI secretion system-associated protein TagF [Methylomonas sp. EFPC3]|uniref:type VI secretion system-associated protein TagF n=1 Tax=Methylomonas sp. EFPC3 TaxID=3021710 RepID=UPI0024159CD6|nr:type VI secretion system-associated protein TagF [Methylomonas sp. EFPC3]WFP49011.1 type VI secretion system-associated protein TagF [Methylomonas sp. EFPC3]
MTNVEPATVGFFGKVPSLGDFVSRRLPRQFIEPWDQWLQSSLRASQDSLGDKWLSSFLVSPLWRFALGPGVCGNTAWAGVMMPSVDRVGRYYPLTLAQPVPSDAVMGLFLPETDWFAQLEDVALSVLGESFDLEAFDAAVSSISWNRHGPAHYFQGNSDADFRQPQGKWAVGFEMRDLSQSGLAYPYLSQALMARFLTCYSVWSSAGTQAGPANLLCCEGLPPIETYADFLKGIPQTTRSWQLHSHKQTLESRQINPAVVTKTEMAAESPPATPSWSSHGVSVVGNKRKHNEDAMLNSPTQGLWVVADGMGGHQSGDLASRLVVDSLSAMAPTESLDGQIEAALARLQKINEDLRRFASGLQQGDIIGTTVVALLACAAECAAIWAGDSRLYQLRGGRFRQLTRDHTLLDELMDSGLMTREVAEQQVGANVITRAVGGQQDLVLDVLRFRAEAGDRYLLCSDGLDKELSEAEIAASLALGDCREATDSLIDQALARSGRDNITVVVAQFG